LEELGLTVPEASKAGKTAARAAWAPATQELAQPGPWTAALTVAEELEAGTAAAREKPEA
jgi:hypothetical protein